MSETNNDQPEPQRVKASITTGIPSIRATIRITPADKIEVEDAETLKYLRLRAGDFQLPQAVFLVVQGERFEITQDELPPEAS